MKKLLRNMKILADAAVVGWQVRRFWKRNRELLDLRLEELEAEVEKLEAEGR